MTALSSPRGDRILPGARFTQLALEPADVGFIAAQHLLDLVDFRAQPVGHFGGLLALDQRGLGKVLAVLFQRQLGLGRPIGPHLVEPAQRSPHLLDVGDRAGGRGANLDQRLFHLEDDHADHPRRVFGPVEKLGHVRRENVASTAEHGAIEPRGDGGEPRLGLGLPHQPGHADRDLRFEDFQFSH